MKRLALFTSIFLFCSAVLAFAGPTVGKKTALSGEHMDSLNSTGSFIFAITATCPAGTSTTSIPPTCYLADAYRIEQLVNNAWTAVVTLRPPTGSSTVPTNYTISGLPIPTIGTFRVVPMLYGNDGMASPIVTQGLVNTNINVVFSITVSMP